ncbi:hypothetical protein ACTWQB_00595 [Piscibacillus sp. B03]|uniref:hypothetical protein n=1 Tax=Piscibacillus sp. B03 TaxID=3457430 RepID=UPI003FCD11D2
MKKENIITAVVLASVLALYIVIQFDKHTVMGEELEKRLGENAEFVQLDVTVFDEQTENHVAASHMTMSADGISNLFEELDSLELTKVDEIMTNARYQLRLTYKKEVNNNHFQERMLMMSVSEDQIFMNRPYEVKDANPVEILETFFDEEGVEIEEMR